MKNNSTISKIFGYLDGTNIILNVFWFGFLIYTVGYSYPGFGPNSVKINQGFQILGILCFLPSLFMLIRWEFDNLYLKIVFSIYISWTVLTILRGISFDYIFLKRLAFNAPFSIFIYLAPIVLLIPSKMEFLRKSYNIVIVLCSFYLLFAALYFSILVENNSWHRLSTGIIETFNHFLAIPAGFLLLTYIYHSKKRNLFVLITFTLSFLLVVIRARRGLMFMTMTIYLVAYLIYYFTNKKNTIKRVFSVFIVLALMLYAAAVYNSNKSDRFSLISNRVNEDTRAYVERWFTKSMEPLDWLIGRGMDGMYYCPGIDETENRITTNRNVIETGYLQIILKGGLVSLILFLLIIIPAVIKGLFYSKNLLSKASALWILLFILYLYPTYVNIFSLSYIYIWFSVGICYSLEFRRKTDEEIKALLRYS